MLRTRLVRVLAVVAILAAAWQAFLAFRAPGVVDPAVAAEVPVESSLRVEVVMDFAPERFHTLFLQSYGRISGSGEDFVRLRDVRPESVGMLARVYWIESIRPWSEG
ncbi:hypothetical protein [Microbacterium sp. Marseille-Q6965]|uniref:hypothetical protein n=1 Tax=Microbacterium sp. Marseille-Q6965 TaxID=2965072 RepID=UPI0021B7C41E|nr:hypothetical protein [Microbacterium sp. Marseille-Q6965]